MRFFTLILLLSCVASVGFAQATGSAVTGRVVYKGQPVVGAVVELKSGPNFTNSVQTKTDGDGRFRFGGLMPGKYLVVSSASVKIDDKKSAYAENRLPVYVKEGSDSSLTLDLTVTEPCGSGPRISEFVEISADHSQPIEQVSKTVDVIDGQEMRERADFTLIDTVRTIPGFRVQQLGGFGRTASIKSRGLRNQDTAVLIDGIRFRDPASITGDASPFLSDFTLTSVSRIEVLRGSGSSLYGTNAIGGTLDFQTARATNGLHGQVSGAAGGLGLGRFRGNLSYGEDNFGITGALSRTAYTKGVDGADNASNTNVQTRLDYLLSSNTNLSGRLFVSDAKVRLNVSPDTLGDLPVGEIIEAREGGNFVADQDDPDSIQDSRFFVGQLSLSHAFHNLLLTGSYQGLVTKRTNEDGLLGPGIFQSEFTSAFGGTIHTANAQAAWTPNASNIFTAGYEFETEAFRNEGAAAGGNDSFWTHADQRSNTIYAQHLAFFFDRRLTLAGGVRAQWFSLDRPEFSEPDGPYANFQLDDPPAAYTFDGSASYLIKQTHTKLRMHIGNGYRVPSLFERFGTFFFFGSFFLQGNPELKPERSLGIDAGVEQYFGKDRIRASATWFYTKIKDEITYLPSDDFGAPVYYNFDRHYSRGLETSIELKPQRSTDIFFSYTFTNSDVRNFRRPDGIVPVGSDRKAYAIPDHQFTLVVTQRFQRFWVSFDFVGTSSYLAPIFSSDSFNSFVYRFRGNRRGDLTAGYTFPLKGDRVNLRLFGTVENLFDYEYFENGFRTAGQHGRVGLNLTF